MLIAGVDPEISAALALVDHDGRLVEVAGRSCATARAAGLP
jgi:predicted RNase H-like nuclease (RuvC/YqgF family)